MWVNECVGVVESKSECECVCVFRRMLHVWRSKDSFLGFCLLMYFYIAVIKHYGQGNL